MNREIILNRIHKDLKITMGKIIHLSKYSHVISQLNDFITKYWNNNGYYVKGPDYMFNWRLLIIFNYNNNDYIYNWNFKKMKCNYYISKNIKLPERYRYTTIKDDIKDVKLINKSVK